MIINKIKLYNFKSIYDPIEIDFKEIKGVWKISGPVGSGKTTIGEAIIFGLFGSINGKNQSDLISWGRKHGCVETWCESKGKNIYIKRELNSYGQSPIYVEVDGEELVFTNKRNAQTQLEQEYFDTSRMTLELLCIISFNNFKSLTSLNSTDTKKFLDQVLGFYTLTEYIEECKNCKNSISIKHHIVRNDKAKLNSQIKKLNEIYNKVYIKGDIDVLSKEISEINNELDLLKHEYNSFISQHNDEKIKLNKRLSSITTLGKNKAKEIEFIKKGVCPTCGAQIDQSQLKVKESERSELLKTYNEVLDKLNDLNKSYEINVELYNKKISTINNELSVLNNKHSLLKQQEKQTKVTDEEIKSIQSQVEELEQLSIKYERDEEEWNTLFEILSYKVKSIVLESFIPIFNKNILKYTQRLQLPYTIQFDNEFKCHISLCGTNENISISSLSTGQLKTVDMVVILGILGTIIGNNGINIMFLDELFSNLDYDLRNEMCSVLREILKEDQTIFIISHMELEDRYFDGDIKVSCRLKDKFEKHSEIKIIENH